MIFGGTIQAILPYLAIFGLVMVLVFFIVRALEQGDKEEEGDWREQIKNWSERTVERKLEEFLANKEYRIAGEIAYSLGRYQEAGEYYLKGSHLLGAVRSFLKQRKFKEAGRVLEKLEDYKHSAELYEQAEDYGSAGQVYLVLGDLKKAGELYEKAGDKKRSAEIYLRAGLFRHANEHFEEVKAHKEGAEALVKFMEQMESRVEGKIEAKDLSFYQELARRSANNFIKAGDKKRAIELMDKLGLLEESAGLLEASGELREASERYKSAGLFLKASECLERLGEEAEAARIRADYFLAQGKKQEAVSELERAEDWERASGLYRELGLLEKSGEALERVGRYQEAGAIWEEVSNWLRAGENYERAGLFEKAGECYEKAGESSKASGMYEQAGDFYRAGSNFYQRGLLDRAIRALQQVNKEDKNFRKACSLLGVIFQEKGMLNLARESLRMAIENQELNRANLEDFYQLGSLNERLGDFEDALAIYEKILLVDIDYQDVRTRLERLRQQKTIIDSRSSVSSLEETQTLKEISPLGLEKPVRYEILEEIGRGGMGIVYKARDTILDRVVAYKVLPIILKDHPQALRNFFREAKSAARLNYPNIVTVYDAGEEAGNYYIAMEYIEGETVKQILSRDGKLPLKAVVIIAGQVCRALEYAHERKVVHRDVKSSNIMWSKDKMVKLMDFGLAKVLEEVKGHQTIASGTPYYMSPEQALGKEVDHRTDIYSLGVTMFEMATGQLPFKTGDAVYHHIHTPPPEAKNIIPEIDSTLNEIILRCMQKEPDVRFQSAKELFEALKKVKVE